MQECMHVSAKVLILLLCICLFVRVCVPCCFLSNKMSEQTSDAEWNEKCLEGGIHNKRGCLCHSPLTNILRMLSLTHTHL